MTRILLVRHGQSEWNALGRWQGQADAPLSELGRRQAAVAAGAIGAVDIIVASDLERATHTATIIGDLIGVGPVVVEPRLRERDAGEWSGLTRAEIDEGWPGYIADHRRPPAFEDEDVFLERTHAALAQINRDYEGADVLVVSHGGVIYALEREAGLPFERVPNLGARQLTHTGNGVVLGERVELVDDEDAIEPQVGPAAAALGAARAAEVRSRVIAEGAGSSAVRDAGPDTGVEADAADVEEI